MAAKKSDLLGVKEMPAKEMEAVLKLASSMKKERKPLLAGMTLAMIFERPSTRTRVSFEVAMAQLGGHSIYLDLGSSQLGRGESMGDTARTLSQYADAIMARVYKHAEIEELARNASVPVINGMSDREHPCQALGDVMTMHEKGIKEVALVGDPQTSTANSLIAACGKAGIAVRVVCPRGYGPNAEFARGAKVEVVHDVEAGVKGAGAIYVSSWKPAGGEEDSQRLQAFLPYQVNSKVLAKAGRGCIVMHALPARRGVEVTSDVLDGPNSAVWEQAANRLHVQKAVLVHLLGKK
jgi:ornithine carbamoyltransferase